MNNTTFFKKYQKPIQIAAAILCFALITLVYFYPVTQGKRIKQHDIEMHKGMAQEITDYRDATGEQTLWTNAPFSGMPAWNISVQPKGNLTNPVYRGLSLGFPYPIGSVFIGMLGFFILLLVLDTGFWISFVGALAYGFTSYLFIIIGAGHNAKAMAMAYMAPVIAGVLLTYKGKYLWGSILTAFSLAFEVRANHLQITYYLAIIIFILIIAEFISDLKDKKLGHFLKASGCLAAAAIIGVMTCATSLYGNYEFGKETTRGKPVLTGDTENQTKGLDRDYITQWSYGMGETWSLLIPNVKGGASALIGKDNPAIGDRAQGNYKTAIANSNAYWGDQPMTSGPVYVGAIVVFLFVLGAITVKGKLKWALLVATLLSILLSWGKNFMGFTNFFLDYFPGYDKFRAVSMTLVIAEVCMPLLGFLGLAEIAKSPDEFKQKLKKFYIAFGITAGICLLFYIMPRVFFSFSGMADEQYNAQLISYFQSQGVKLNPSTLEENLADVRVAIFRKDASRSLLFIVLAAVPLLLYGKGKMKGQIVFPILAVLVLLDMFLIDKRYLNNDNFIDKSKFDKPYVASVADKSILSDKTLDFRTADLTKDIFNDASLCYFHKSLGGYSGAKLRRYQDVITRYLGSELNQLRSCTSLEEIRQKLKQQKVLDMLNTKYIIFNHKAQALSNPYAFGNAWIVNDVRWVSTPNEEIDAIADTDLEHTAIINKEFEQKVGDYHTTNNAKPEITLVDYKPNKLTYSFNSISTGSTASNFLVVFSEIWTEKGWKMYIDGQESPLLRANYILRCALVPSGNHEIVMEYAPKAYSTGNTIAFVSSLIMILGLIAALYITFKARKAEDIEANTVQEQNANSSLKPKKKTKA